ncbi:MAG TPA: diphosphate--fructose-6-phosphate 1-phosphotransferase [Candidatus Omnitrophota bacterium]|nr:diphosphate--fructose-6-phosphate 1-phosphotransferase [Candidatus Omnitrophota bacterium]
MQRKKGIVTPLKGKAILGQSGGCTAVINQSLAGILDAAKSSKAITQIWGAQYGVTGILTDDLVDLKVQPKNFSRDIRNLPSAVLGSSRYKLQGGEEFEILEKLEKWDVRYLFLIGGNDTAETVLRIAEAARDKQYELRVVHVPKTIDNDLVETDHCPGYGSVARFAAITTQEAGWDTKSMRHVDPVKIIELMGRNSGWIVAASALLKRSEKEAPHLLLLPEVPFEESGFLGNVERVLRDAGYCVVVISETIRDEAGKRVGTKKEGIVRDGFGHVYVEGAAAYLAQSVERNLKVRARYDKPGTIQRMSIPYVSSVDQREAYEAGERAVQWALKGISKVMVGFVRQPGPQYRIQYCPVPLEKIPNREWYFPTCFLNSEKTGISPAFSKYALPLIGDRLPEFPEFKFKKADLRV